MDEIVNDCSKLPPNASHPAHLDVVSASMRPGVHAHTRFEFKNAFGVAEKMKKKMQLMNHRTADSPL